MNKPSLPFRLVLAGLLATILTGCAAPPPEAAAPPPAGQGDIVTDYGGGSAPVARYLRLPDGRVMRLAPDGAGP